MKNVLLILGVLFLAIIIQSCANQVDKKKEKATLTQADNPVEWSKNAVIYEVNVRQFSEEGSFKAVEEQLPRLKKLGVDVLWMMPIFPIGLENRKGSLGSFYSIEDYLKVNPNFGSLADMQSLIKKTHDMGMHIILDWVANHSAWDNPWVKEHPEYYKKDSSGKMISPFDWTDVVAFDYSNKGMRKAMTDAMLYWVKDMNVDGFRCDVAGEVPSDFWENARIELDKVKPVFMLAEAEKPELVQKAFDMDYGWNEHHIMNEIAKGKQDANDLNAYFDKKDKEYPARSYKMYFITNHDENSWNGTVEERLGAAADAMAVLTFTVGDMPLIYNGQEAALNKRLLFFEKDPIHWGNYSKADFYQKLTNLKHKQAALWNGPYGKRFVRYAGTADQQVFAFARGNVSVILNLSDKGVDCSLKDADFSNYKIDMQAGFAYDSKTKALSLKPWAYAVLVKK